ncbi:hypothetical protein A3B32_02155 [Candidatus Uhrbacteria bacterium RIFCSPLOWO2_01_FULL_53_9]|uniref:Transcription regulator TrmB N-terminal domain-containing protein n=2 Tax=Candidatus Uhriibacteriota TaxID=1752732 RepID=A0A1F7UYZ3_9BACT|nr:MAG: hypothetical protein A3C17_01560 [Candidatus Uhrbacteria bacterium RIFCSPHIGHO2_02_FULL_53_13]OGL82974.1 MAG: hypothetical protein A3B32_02155 [Candidatus Uhrbacteria bacterium RIFCSPLOWO2_01_FULL_53_9]
MYIELFQNLGLSKNEAELYEALLEQGEASVSKLNQVTNINRRNIYDVLNRMTEKGLVFLILRAGENRYKPVDPLKLKELVQEKLTMLEEHLDELDTLYRSKPKTGEVFIYRGLEGWKNYMRDILRLNETAYFIGAKGLWLEERVKNFFPKFHVQATKQRINFFTLFDWEIQTECPEILPYVKTNYKFLPKEYSTRCGIDIVGDHVYFLSDLKIKHFEEDFAFTVIVNQTIADSYRTWFRYMWDLCPTSSLERVESRP